ncbi:unnamed protein product, partial [Didymodactylos carnosus]
CLLTILFFLNVTNYVTSATLVSSDKTTKADIASPVIYQVRDGFYSLSNSSINRATSEHFQIIWGNKDTTGSVNLEFIQGNLANLESIRLFYIEKIGLGDIGRTQDPAITGTYKTNIYIALTGLDPSFDDWAYMGVDKDSFGFIMMMPGAMRVDPPSWVVPHELAHAFIFHNGGVVPYAWNEALSNFLRNEYLYSDYYSYGGTIYGPTSDFFAPYILNSEVHFPSAKNWYDSWPIFLYIYENPDYIIGLGKQALLKIMTYRKEETTYFKAITAVTHVSIKEILGGMARRMVTMDFKAQKYYLQHLDELLKIIGNREKIYTTLKNENDGWMVVPANKAPQQAGYNIIPLTIPLNTASITVNFQGTSTDKNADWRVSIVTVTKSNNTINLHGDEKGVYLVVVATPDFIPFIDIDKDGITYPYKVQVTTR